MHKTVLISQLCFVYELIIMCELHYHTTHHFLNVIKGLVDTYIIPGVTMAEHACSSFTIKNDYGSEVSSQMESLRESKDIIILHGTFFELERSIGKYSVGHKVEDLEELARCL